MRALALTYTLPADYSQFNQVYDFDGYGSRVVHTELYDEHGGFGKTVWLVDLETGERSALNEPEERTVVLGPQISGDAVVWSTARSLSDDGLAWQVVHFDLASDSSDIIDEGVNRRQEDGSPSAPSIALKDDFVAYTVESPTDSYPFGWKIVVRRLSDGARVREVQTRYAVWHLAVDDGNVLYSEVAPSESGASDSGLMLSTTDQPTPRRVWDQGSDLSLEDDRIVWAAASEFAVGVPTMSQSVYTAASDDLEPQVLVRLPEGSIGGAFPAAGDGIVAWSDLDSLFVWNIEADTRRRLITTDALHSSYLLSVAGGWLAWSVSLDTPVALLSEFGAVKIDDLQVAEAPPQ